LRQEHPLWVYSDIDKQRNTVGVDLALERLARCDVVFDQEDIARIKRARDIRNSIVHYDIRIDRNQLRQSYIDLFEFIHVFHLDAFSEEVHAHIRKNLQPLEAALMEDFRRESVSYQGARMIKTFPSRVLAAQYTTAYAIDGHEYERIRWAKPDGRDHDDCNDCGVIPGQFHVPSCDNELCPRCRDQWISCDCESSDPENNQGKIEPILGCSYP